MTQNTRSIALDTETTGLDPLAGDRIVEIGAVELINDVPTGKTLHLYINPERSVPSDAVRVHGLTNAFLDDKPKFAAVAREFIEFIGEDQLVIHNAKFDVGFLNAELTRINGPQISMSRVVDTMDISRRRFPGSPLTLDALCRRFDISLENRKIHGALLDAQLLGEVWLGLNGGRQPEMLLVGEGSKVQEGRQMQFSARRRPTPLPSRLSDSEISAHQAIIARIDASARKASKGEFGALWPPAPEDPQPGL